MDWGPVLAAAVTAAGAVIVTLISLLVARRFGLGPVQHQYVEILGRLNEAKDQRIVQLEQDGAAKDRRIAHLEDRVEHLEAELGRIERELREAESRLGRAKRRREPGGEL